VQPHSDRIGYATSALFVLISAGFWRFHVVFAPIPPPGYPIPDWWVMPLMVVWLATLCAVAAGADWLRRRLSD